MRKSGFSGLIISLAIAGVAGVGYVQLRPARSIASPGPERSAAPVWPGHDPTVVFSAPGVTEPASRTLEIFSEVPGIIRAMHVSSGDRVSKSQVLFELDNDTQMATVRHRQALVRVAEANLTKLESGDREEDRRMVKAQWEEAEAMLHLADYEHRRVEALLGQNATTDKEIIYARENLAAARARAEAAKARYDRAINGPREEDLEVVRATVAEAESQLQIARTHLEKTIVRSPIDGLVIYRFREPGEAVIPDMPKPVLSLGNRDTLNLRADVDENDCARVKLGQQVFATADAFEGHRFTGQVVHIENTLGRKNFRTYRPAEKADTKILEVVIALDDGGKLPLDLQMTIWFTTDNGPKTAAVDNPAP